MAMLTSLPAEAAFLAQPLPTLAAWTQRLQDTSRLPVLATTARRIEDMRDDEDRVDANRLGELISNDPLMTLKVMAHASMQAGIRAVLDMPTVTATLVMMGIPPFFRAFGVQPSIEDRFADRPGALAGILEAVRQARRAADFAWSFAAQLGDANAPVIHAATLLHDFAELLIWCHAPDLAMDMRSAGALDPSLPPGAVQRQILNIELLDLQRSLMTVWRLPGLLAQVQDERLASRPNVQCVQFAVRLARHSAHGWSDPRLAEDHVDIGRLLDLSPAAVAELVQAV